MWCEGEGGEGDSDIGIQLSQSRHTRLSSAGENEQVHDTLNTVGLDTMYVKFLKIFLCGQDT